MHNAPITYQDSLIHSPGPGSGLSIKVGHWPQPTTGGFKASSPQINGFRIGRLRLYSRVVVWRKLGHSSLRNLQPEDRCMARSWPGSVAEFGFTSAQASSPFED